MLPTSRTPPTGSSRGKTHGWSPRHGSRRRSRRSVCPMTPFPLVSFFTGEWCHGSVTESPEAIRLVREAISATGPRWASRGVSPEGSLLVSNKRTVSVNDRLTINAFLRDKAGSSVAGRRLRLISARNVGQNQDTIDPTLATTDSEGRAFFTVATSSPGKFALSLLSADDGELTVAQPLTVRFLAAPAGVTPITSSALDLPLPSSSTQYHVQVIPANNDGPAINLIRNAERSFVLEPPIRGEGNYVLLPGMTYRWRYRYAAGSQAMTESSAGWSDWSRPSGGI